MWQKPARYPPEGRKALGARSLQSARRMQAFPHRYDVHADAAPSGTVPLQSAALPPLATAPPAQFGGPGDHWSPETLLVAAVVDCFILTFRAIATASKLAWQSLACDAEGALDRADGVLRFTALQLRARLELPAGGDPERARRLLEKAERTCLVSNSLAFRPTLAAEVTVAA